MPWGSSRKAAASDVSAALEQAQAARQRLDKVLNRLDAAIDKLADTIMSEDLADIIALRKEADDHTGRTPGGGTGDQGAADGGSG